VLDIAAMGFVCVLGIGFAGPSAHYSARVTLLLLPPAGVLAVAVVLFLCTKSPLVQGVAFRLAVVTTPALALSVLHAKGPAGEHAVHEFDERKQKAEFELEKVINSADIQAVTKALPKANINAQTGARGTAQTMALDKVNDTGQGLDVLQAVLNAGADPNINAGVLPLPLERAISHSRSRRAKPMLLLLDAGAKPNLGSIHDVPVFFAATQVGNAPAATQLLLERGADLKLLDKRGASALDWAMGERNWQMALFLVEKGAVVPDATAKRLDAAAQKHGNGEGLAELIAFVKKAARGGK
jgi:hypothetical protein